MDAPSNKSPDPEERPLIELAPLTPANILPVGGKFEERWVTQEQQVESGAGHIPVPAEPLHLCPTCDYNLTGLTARRCPECGEPFTMADARDRGVEKSIGFNRYFSTDRYERLKYRLGWALLFAGFFLPVLLMRPAGRTAWTQRGGGLIFLMPIFLAFACFYKVIRDRTWGDAILVAGLGSALLGAAITFL
jgi:hypothetical protein